MLENQPNDALGKLVKLVKLVNLVKLVKLVNLVNLVNRRLWGYFFCRKLVNFLNQWF